LSRTSTLLASLETFLEDEWITGAPKMVKSGKEATVFCCKAYATEGSELLAAKVYRSRQNRSFKNDAVYQEGRVILDKRLGRAVKNKSRKGRETQFALWLLQEYGILQTLHNAGADVPKPYTVSEDSILMDYIGDIDSPAPQLANVTLEPEEALPLFERVLRNVEIALTCNLVHGDLSSFNILYWNGRITVIDFPQAVDPRFNKSAYALLQRDLENVIDYFAEYGVQAHAGRITHDLWARHVRI
jgi:RIO kinase 1